MAESQYSGKKPGYKKAPTQAPRVNDKPGFQADPAKNDTSKRGAAPRRIHKGTNPGAH